LAIHREVGNRRDEGFVLGNLGLLHSEQGRWEDARLIFEAPSPHTARWATGATRQR
jgi:hypothetical protein